MPDTKKNNDSTQPSARAIVKEALKRDRTHLGRLRRHFLAGLLVVTPVGLTIWIVVWLFDLIDGNARHFLSSLLERFGLEYQFTLFGKSYELIPFGFGLLIVFFGTCFAGMIASNYLGRRVLRFLESVIRRVPIVSWIYNICTQVSHAFLSRKTNVFTEVVMVEYPRRCIYSVGLVTNKKVPGMEVEGGEKLWSVFIPTTPNPTSGYLLFIPESQCSPISLTVEEAMKLVVSGGVVVPDSLREGTTILPKSDEPGLRKG